MSRLSAPGPAPSTINLRCPLFFFPFSFLNLHVYILAYYSADVMLTVRVGSPDSGGRAGQLFRLLFGWPRCGSGPGHLPLPTRFNRLFRGVGRDQPVAGVADQILWRTM